MSFSPNLVPKELPNNLSGMNVQANLKDSVSSIALERAEWNTDVALEIDITRHLVMDTLAA